MVSVMIVGSEFAGKRKSDKISRTGWRLEIIIKLRVEVSQYLLCGARSDVVKGWARLDVIWVLPFTPSGRRVWLQTVVRFEATQFGENDLV